jgi:hypothetical protein
MINPSQRILPIFTSKKVLYDQTLDILGNIGYKNTVVINCHSTVITKVMLL